MLHSIRKLLPLIILALFGCMIGVACSDSDSHDEDSEEMIDLPPSIGQYITSNYPSNQIKEAKLETSCNDEQVYEVELESDSEEEEEEELELVFNLEGTFLYSKIEIKTEDLPGTITQNLESTYPDHKVEEAVRLKQIDDVSLYIVELENEDSEVEVLIDDIGNVICELPDDDD